MNHFSHYDSPEKTSNTKNDPNESKRNVFNPHEKIFQKSISKIDEPHAIKKQNNSPKTPLSNGDPELLALKDEKAAYIRNRMELKSMLNTTFDDNMITKIECKLQGIEQDIKDVDDKIVQLESKTINYQGPESYDSGGNESLNSSSYNNSPIITPTFITPTFITPISCKPSNLCDTNNIITPTISCNTKSNIKTEEVNKNAWCNTTTPKIKVNIAKVNSTPISTRKINSIPKVKVNYTPISTPKVKVKINSKPIIEHKPNKLDSALNDIQHHCIFNSHIEAQQYVINRLLTCIRINNNIIFVLKYDYNSELEYVIGNYYYQILKLTEFYKTYCDIKIEYYESVCKTIIIPLKEIVKNNIEPFRRKFVFRPASFTDNITYYDDVNNNTFYIGHPYKLNYNELKNNKLNNERILHYIPITINIKIFFGHIFKVWANNDLRKFNIILNWLRFIIENPQKSIGFGLGLYTDNYKNVSIILDFISANIIGDNLCSNITLNDLFTDMNSHFINSRLCVIDGNINNLTKNIKLNKMQDCITNTKVICKKKYQYTIPVTTLPGMIMMTNNLESFYFDAKKFKVNDRYFIIELNDMNDQYLNTLNNYLNISDNYTREILAFYITKCLLNFNYLGHILNGEQWAQNIHIINNLRRNIPITNIIDDVYEKACNAVKTFLSSIRKNPHSLLGYDTRCSEQYSEYKIALNSKTKDYNNIYCMHLFDMFQLFSIEHDYNHEYTKRTFNGELKSKFEYKYYKKGTELGYYIKETQRNYININIDDCPGFRLNDIIHNPIQCVLLFLKENYKFLIGDIVTIEFVQAFINDLFEFNIDKNDSILKPYVDINNLISDYRLYKDNKNELMKKINNFYVSYIQ